VHDNFSPYYKIPRVGLPVQRFVLTGVSVVLMALLLVSALRAQQSNPDLDGDGVIDVLDLDQDNDGISNSLEGVHRLEDLSGLDAVFFAAVPSEVVNLGLSRDYDLVSTENGSRAVLAGRVLSTDTTVEWGMYDALPRLRNLSSGSTTVQWTVVGQQGANNIDMTISDLDGARNETISVSAASIVGYSLSLNSNVLVSQANGQISFTGTGAGGDSNDDLVTLHFRKVPLIVVSYKNAVQSPREDLAVDSANSEIDIAGYRHSLEHKSSVFFTPVTQFRDTDGDGVSDHRDLDSDNDGLGDVVEAGGIDTDNNNLIDGTVNLQGVSRSVDPGLDADAVAAVYFATVMVSGTDSDGDGLLSSVDGLPSKFGGSLAGRDSDSDGLSDLDEVRIFQTNPVEPDSDSDGLDDQSEIENFLTDPLQSDTDGDDLSDGDELNVFGTSPIKIDSDSDGIADGIEVERDTDPLQAEPAIVGEPQAAIELEPVLGSEEDAAPIINSGDNAVLQDDGDTPAGTDVDPSDDQMQVAVTSVRTGLGGAPGCSGFAAATPEPLLLLVLLMSIGCLVRTSKRMVNH